MHRFLALLLMAVLASAPANAERPVAPDQFNYSAQGSYVLVWVGPMLGHKSFRGWLDFMKISPETGLTSRTDKGELRTINARAIKDAAAVYNEAKPFIVQGDLGLFLIPVIPGRWVLGGVNGTALSLGSYGFDIPAGTVTYVGKVLVGSEDGSSDVPEIKARGELPEAGLIRRSAPEISTIVLRRPSLSDIPSDILPQSITGHISLAKIDEGIRFNNYLGGVINRAADLGPIPHALPIKKEPH